MSNAILMRGAGVPFNIDYGSTPPDTSMLWAMTDECAFVHVVSEAPTAADMTAGTLYIVASGSGTRVKLLDGADAIDIRVSNAYVLSGGAASKVNLCVHDGTTWTSVN